MAAPRRRSPGRRPRRAYQQASSVLRDAFAQPDVLSLMFPSPIGTVPGVALLHLRITEMLVHGWDLAQATAQPARLPDDLAEQELRFTRAKLGDIPAGRSPFAPPQPVSGDAPAIDRLAACLGRRVTPGGTARA
ncbi:MAG TPA: TIGR03086 family metal-binding protein [Streptosporangiaceae bacterium]|nr:TIGR03086 family metal-binding protein [Streptosporangiaceae bacterium]